MPEYAQLIHLAVEVSLVMCSVGQFLAVSSLLTFQERHLCPQL